MFETAKTQTGTVIDADLRDYMLKVYNFMAGGLAVTALAAYICLNTPLLRLFFSVSPSGQISMSVISWLLLFAPFAMIFAFGWVLNRGSLQQVQGVFWGFSALMGISLTPVLVAYTGASVARIFLITAAMFGSMSIYGYTTKKDLSSIGSFVIMGVWGLIIASLVNIFFKSPGLSYAISVLTVLAFTVLTAYDTQKIHQMYMSGDMSDTLTRKAIAGALALYMDFINMFLSLLHLFGERR